MDFKNIFLVMGFLGVLVSCSTNLSEPEPENEIEEPTVARLIFPENNTECNEGEAVNESLSSVVFRWNASEHTDSYEVNVQIIDTDSVSKINVETNEAKITIERGTAYRWFVISKSSESGTTAKSETWQFYNAGIGTIDHVPFPANAISPKNGSEISPVSGKIDLEWEASDIDGDISEFKVFFGKDNTPEKIVATTMARKIDVEVITGDTYFWLVETEDSSNNVSRSDVFSFKVK